MQPAPHQAITAGFADASTETQSVFRSVMNALAHPTRVEPLRAPLAPPSPLTPELAAIALTLADVDAPIWLDATLASDPAVAAFLRFHTGAPIVDDPRLAVFALVANPAALIPLDRFAVGTEEYPDSSTTLVIAVEGFDGAVGFVVDGPGLASSGHLMARPLPADFRAQWLGNQAQFPRGVDVIFAASGSLCALPRSSRLTQES